VYSVPRAVAVLLANTGLEGNFSAEGHLLITQVDQTKGKSMNTSKRKNVLATMVGLFATAGGVGSALGQGDEAATAQGRIDEIIVTANKREQSLQDTAMSISALSSDTIEKRGLVGMGDYLATTPGVSQADFGVGRNRVTMRGLASASSEEGTVGIYLGEVPLNNLTNGSAPDIKLVDMERVEVLRGPQGTLYGSGTMGGAVRNIPKAPNLEEFEAELQVGLSTTDNSSGNNNKTTGVINIPLVENEFSLRVAAYRFKNQGYTDLVSANDPAKVAAATAFGGVVLNQEGLGDTEFTGGRVSLLWRATDALEVTLMHVNQDLQQVGLTESNVALGGYQDIAFDLNGHLGGDEGYTEKSDITNLVVEYDLGWGSFLSSSTLKNVSADWALVIRSGPPFPLAADVKIDNDGFSQEFRMSSQFDGAFQVLGGLYYENLESISPQDIIWVGDDTLMPAFLGSDPDGLFSSQIETHIQQKAVFGEMSYRFSEELTLTLGGRWFEYDRKEFQLSTGPFAGPTGILNDENANEDGIRGKVNLSYSPNDNTLIYTQWSQGFRLGEPITQPPASICDTDNDNILDGTAAPINDALESDEIDSAEIGGKFTLLNNRLVINTAAYYIEWDGIPINVRSPVSSLCSTKLNAGSAVSKGLEIEASYHFTDRLQLNLGASFNNAELSEDAGSLGLSGDRLPLSPRSNASLGIDYSFELAGYSSFFRVNYAYIGGFHNDLQETSVEMGDYDKLGLRAGVVVDSLDIELYGTNLSNSDELVSIIGSGGYRIAPRQFGLEMRYRF